MYNSKLGFLNVNVKGLYNNRGFDQGGEPTVADVSTVAAGVKVSTDPLDTIFKPSVEGQVGYLSRDYSGSNVAASNYGATGLSYRAGVKLNDFLLPTGKLAVYYAGLNAKNRTYTPWNNSTDNTAGYYGDQNTGYSINENGLYVEGNYYDLSFAYGLYNLSATDGSGPKWPCPAVRRPRARPSRSPTRSASKLFQAQQASPPSIPATCGGVFLWLLVLGCAALTPARKALHY